MVLTLCILTCIAAVSSLAATGVPARAQEFPFGLEMRLEGARMPGTKRIPSLENLSVLPAGALPPNPQELLTRPMFGHLLRELAEHVDMILLDSPPAARSADAQTLAMRAGAALVVVRKSTSRMARVQHVAQSVARTKSTIVGAVFNDF